METCVVILPSGARSVQLLEPLGKEERQQVIECLRPRLYRPGDLIIREGDEGHEFFVLIEGEATVSKEPWGFLRVKGCT